MKKYSSKENLVLSVVNNGTLYTRYSIGEKVAKKDLQGLLNVIESMVQEQATENKIKFNEYFKIKDIKEAIKEVQDYYIEDMGLIFECELLRENNTIYGNPVFSVVSCNNIDILNFLINRGYFKTYKKGVVKTSPNYNFVYGIFNTKKEVLDNIVINATQAYKTK